MMETIKKKRGRGAGVKLAGAPSEARERMWRTMRIFIRLAWAICFRSPRWRGARRRTLPTGFDARGLSQSRGACAGLRWQRLCADPQHRPFCSEGWQEGAHA